jgi:hypothetical protein
MRYYDVKITDPKSGTLVQPSFMQKTGVQSTFTSFVNGQTLPGALDIELDIPLTTYDTPWFGSRLTVWGVGIKELAQSNDLNGKNIEIRAGMKPGLPLATAASQDNQAGLILSGTIYQAFGNWIGNEMRLDMILQPPTGGGQTQVNLQFACPANQPMAQAIKQCITTALGNAGYEVKVSVSPQFVFNYDQKGTYSKLSSFANWLKRVSKSQQFNGIKTTTGIPYSTNGVSVSITGKTVLVYDGTDNGYANWSSSKPREIKFQDMIGQPTFIDPVSMNFKTVLRADISVGDYIKMPQQLAAPYVVTAPAAAVPGSPARNKAIFQGMFLVRGVHHFARFRQADGASWCTVFDCVIINPTPSGTSSSTTSSGGTAP